MDKASTWEAETKQASKGVLRACVKRNYLRATVRSFLRTASAAHHSLHLTSAMVSDMGWEGKGSGLAVGTDRGPGSVIQD